MSFVNYKSIRVFFKLAKLIVFVVSRYPRKISENENFDFFGFFKQKNPEKCDKVFVTNKRFCHMKMPRKKSPESSSSSPRSSSPERNDSGVLKFPDFPSFKPNLTPKEILQVFITLILLSLAREWFSHQNIWKYQVTFEFDIWHTMALFTRDIFTHNIAIKRYCDKKIFSGHGCQ